MGVKPRRKPRRQAAVHRRPLQKRLIASDPAKPPTWPEWKATTGRRWWRYPLAVEWALEWFVYRLRGLALFELLELAGRTTVLVVAIFWILEADNRAKERHYRAWDLIDSARGSTPVTAGEETRCRTLIGTASASQRPPGECLPARG